jgi:FlaA1/EpsC-like NDP-sugar epimerase
MNFLKKSIDTIFFIKVAIDLFLVFFSYFFSYLVRFEFSISRLDLFSIRNTLPFIILIKLIVFFYFRLYRAIWRYFSILDIINLAKAVFVANLVIILAIFIYNRFEGYPRSVFLFDGILSFLLLGGARLAIRIHFSSKSPKDFFPFLGKTFQGKPLLILGAGQAGEKVIREINDNPKIGFYPMGFLDDDQTKIGRTLQGIPILGKIDDISEISSDFEEILIAIPSAKGEQMRRIVEVCDKSGKKFRTLPAIGELIDGSVSLKAIREVTLGDLLGREEVLLDRKEIGNYLQNKRILVTGAGGSIGSELVRQISKFYPHSLALLEMSEHNLFQIEMEGRQRFGFIPIRSFLVNIQDRKALQHVFNEFSPQVVFHAAAYKHVPIQEIHPWEAVFNNILGSRNLFEASVAGNVEKFVLISTDKAVRPTNVMGASKRVTEMLMERFSLNHQALFMSVRFGNVLGSSGSAVPLFQEQIARGGPVTVTHPEITRYFMSIPEAAQLILQAGAFGKGGEIFILDMGKPVKIIDLVKDLIRLHGLEPEKDIPIQYVGLRPGEKLFEELITAGENILTTSHKKILVLKNDNTDHSQLMRQIDELLEISRNFKANDIKNKLKEMVPEYTPFFDNLITM